MACGGNCPCCKDKKKAKKRVTKKKAAVPARAPPHRMVKINVLPPVGEGAPRWKKDLVSVDTIGGLPSPVKKYSSVGTQTDRPRNTASIETQTEKAIKEELQAPRPAKYIRQPVSVSTREPTMAVIEPPSRYATQLETIRRRMPYTQIATPRTAEMITQTEDAPSGTRVTRKFHVVPETRGRRPVDPTQRLMTDMFSRIDSQE
jgi:hypothetical protein